ncbi:MAG: arginine--tRNA ligase [Pseudomonadota bacterium]
MNLFAEIRTLTLDCLAAMMAEGALPEGLALDNVTVEPPRDAAHGDMATNAAMVLAKPAGMKPRAIAEGLSARLAEDPRIASAEVAGPGFINLRLAPAAWHSVLEAILTGPEAFGRSTAGAGRKVNVEFVSANPTGPLHVGHTRGAVFGDALARLLDFAGWAVTREYYINDGGAQVDVLARSVYLRYCEALGREIEIPAGLYPGDYLVPVGQALAERYGQRLFNAPEEEWLPEFREAAIEAMLVTIRDDLGALGVHMDVYFSEKSLYGTGRIEATLEALDGKGLIYQGVLQPPKGKTPEDWEPRPQTLFRSSDYGDDTDRPIRKADGSWTYFAPDIAYHKDKLDRGFDLLIDVLGADHGGYVKRMKAAVAALSDNHVDLDVKLCQLVRLFKDGEPFKMSKRAGRFVTLRDVLDEVGPDVTRFVMLMRKNDAPLDFDFTAALEQSRENPVWYVQYAFARIRSLQEKAETAGISRETAPERYNEVLSLLQHSAELALVAKLAAFPRVVESAALHHEPHRVAFYLYDLASEFHGFWNLGQDEPSLRMVREHEQEISKARLCLARGVATVVSSGLGILGVAPIDVMK